MAETTSPEHIIKRECTCGKKGDDIDNCSLCLEYRAKQLPQHDSYIFSALKLAIVEAFFKQQGFYHPTNGSYITYGGQAVDMVKHILERPDFKQMMIEITSLIVAKKEDWYNMAINAMSPVIDKRGKEMVESWDLKDELRSTLHQVALLKARELFEKDEVLMAKIKEKIQSQDYTVKFDIRVEIVEKREGS